MTLPSNSALAGTPTFPFCSWKSLGNAAGLTLEGKMRKFATRCYLVGRHCSEGCNAGLARPFSDDLDETNDEICAKANNSRSVPWDHWECESTVSTVSSPLFRDSQIPVVIVTLD